MMILITLIAFNMAWITVCYNTWKAGYNKGVNDAEIEFLKEARQQQRYTIFGKPAQSIINAKTSVANEVLNSVPAEVVGNTAKRELTEKMIEQLEKYVHVKQDNRSTTFSLNLLVADKGEI